MQPKFDAKKTWEAFLDMDTDPHNDDVSVFMAVPTIYAKLIQEYHNMGDKLDHIDVKDKIMSKIRLMVCGSAHLPDVSNISFDKSTSVNYPKIRRRCTKTCQVQIFSFEYISVHIEFLGENNRIHPTREVWYD